MGAEEALQLLDELVFIGTRKHLTDNQRKVFQRSFQGETYPEMAQVMHLEPETVKDIGFELWNLLSEVLGEKVTKKNFRAALGRAQVSRQESCSNLSPVPQQVEASQERGDLAETLDDLGFVGRREAIADLNSLMSQGAKMILIHAAGGVGKSKLAYRYLKTQGFDVVLELWMAKETQNITSAESVVEEWLQRYLDEEPGREFGVSLERLRQKLRERSRRIGILIDNLEPALDRDGKFIANHRSYVELLRVLADPDTKAVTLITSRERLRESAITPQVYALEGLDESAWQQFFEGRGIQVDVLSLNVMHKTYAGNAKAMEILAGAVQIDFAGNLTAYWQVNQADFLVEKDLEDLVASQFNRLQVLNSDAYKLLCRLGSYRYQDQDVQTIPIEGLFCMLWDIPEQQHRRVIKILQDRSLVNFRDEGYSLHPVIRAEAIARLRNQEDWKVANTEAAVFWTESVTTIETSADARQAFEAYYHYVEIEELELACQVLIKERENKWFITKYGKEALCRAFHRLGLLQNMISTIASIVDNVPPSFSLARLYNLLGDFYVQAGSIYQAIESHRNSKKIVDFFLLMKQQSNEETYQKFKILELFYFFNMGICKVCLWELEEAFEFFKEALPLSNAINFIVPQVEFLLAFINSELGYMQDASYLAKQVCKKIENIKDNAWGIGYGFIFLGKTYKNLGEFEVAIEMFNNALLFAEESQYAIVKADALVGLAELLSIQGDFETAISRYMQAIEIMDELLAKYNLAEAYFKLGLTYHMASEIEKSREYCYKSKHLFEEMRALRQIERVDQAFRALQA